MIFLLEVNALLKPGDLFIAVFGLGEVAKARASGNKVVCCHFSSDGELFATLDLDKKAQLSAQNYDLNYSPV